MVHGPRRWEGKDVVAEYTHRGTGSSTNCFVISDDVFVLVPVGPFFSAETGPNASRS